ncbi:hypothetical protein [Legionella cardiaca]|uniref:Uncharacterized protein n=1 Tax=Legionella cardiaca TaxID=1071983 RepID=A0ABY8ARY0_9GAMM|nr:hypothetical protein [Legionella cardiaca]WED41917.1 hypothetical protein PXX05_08205 [Legionella cardiaca]
MDSYKKFTIQYLLIVISLCLTIILFNWLINPYNIYKSLSIKNINKVKPQVTFHLRLAKAMAVEWKKPEVIILGSSTAETGLDPTFLGWHTKSIYNLGLSGANIYEVLRYLQHAQSIRPLKKVVLAVNFFMFNAYVKNREDFDEAILLVDRNGKKNPLKMNSFFSTLLSYDALKASITTIQSQNQKNAFLSNGQLAHNYRTDQVQQLKGYKNHFLYAEKFNPQTFFPDPTKKFAFIDSKHRINTLSYMQQIIDICTKNNTELIIVLVPEHVRLLETYKLLGLWSRYEEWQKTLVNLIQEHNDHYPHLPYTLWSFNKLNSYTTESLPAGDDNSTVMKWFWDPFHFKNELGNLLLSVILNKQSQPNLIDFSTPLDTTNFLAEFNNNAQALKKWESENLEQVNELKKNLL